MIRLNEKTREKDRIIELLSSAIETPDYEFECIFGGQNQKGTGIEYSKFSNLIRRVKGKKEFLQPRELYTLNITFPPTSKYSGIRVAIKGQNPILNYCNSNNVQISGSNVEYQTKKRVDLGRGKSPRVQIPNYKIRFNLNSEGILDKSNPIITELLQDWGNIDKIYRYKKTFNFLHISGKFSLDLSIVKTNATSDKFITVKEVIDGGLFSQVEKPREIKTPFSIWWDAISKTPDEKVFVRGIPTYYKTVEESRIFTNVPSYEVEIEYIGNKQNTALQALKINPITKFDNSESRKTYILATFSEYFAIIGMVLQVLQNSFYIMNIEELQMVKDQYIKMLNNSMQNMKKINGESGESGDTDKAGETGDTGDKAGETGDKTGETKIVQVKQDDQAGGAIFKRQQQHQISRIFFGPLAIDLNWNNITHFDVNNIPDPSTNINIQINYVVTDKADGERELLYIAADGKCYFIDRQENFAFTGLIMPGLANSVYDGEFINLDSNGKFKNNYYAFDCYIFNGSNIMNLPFGFGSKDGRHEYLQRLSKYFSTSGEVMQSNARIPLLIFKKEFYPSDTPKSFAASVSNNTIVNNSKPRIYQSCAAILGRMNRKYGGLLDDGHMFTYATDGLIFTPNNFGVFQEFSGHHVNDLFKASVWSLNYKWKPVDHLTIDFKLVFDKSIDTKTIKYIYRENLRFVEATVICKVWQSAGPDKNASLNFWLINQGIDLRNIPEDFPFAPTNPFVGEVSVDGTIMNHASKTLLRVDSNDNIVCENGDIIIDGMTVECRYNRSKIASETGERWIPIRVRPDKVPNAINTAANCWNLINNPINTDLMITGITEEYEKTLSIADVIYYSGSNKNIEFITSPGNKFHNYVKSVLIERAVSHLDKPAVLDFATGKCGDFFKFANAGVNKFVGVEINRDNIHSVIDGSAKRLMSSRGHSPSTKRLIDNTLLINADASHDFASGTGALDPLNKYYIDLLFGRASAASNKLEKFKDLGLDGFHVVSIMYALHYMMDNEEMLNTMLQNVSYSLREQGYFIGCILDGDLILKSMRGGDKTEGWVDVNGGKDRKLIFSIEKIPGIDYSVLTTGNKIMSYFETFEQPLPENLISIDYLTTKAAEYKLKLIESRTFMEEPGSLFAEFAGSSVNIAGKFAEQIEKTPAMRAWSEFNRMFIFQKVHSMD